ncbi:alpha/beta fold hydrolase [Spongisporangium articulatum]|uniref:Alpha/beta fold hydrolase n=1 Tax=Spongisporangium articulatum TaxID=3362603 RepID=A0ABW8AJ76_9ACTN
MLSSLLNGQVFGERVGSGAPAVLALHGWRRTHADLMGVFGDLPGLAIDLPGFGASPTPTEAWGSPEYATALLPLLDDLAEPRIVVGHSFGGRVAVQLAAAAPERVKGLVLTGVPLIRGEVRPPSLGYRLLRGATNKGLIPAKYLEARKQRTGSDDYRAATGVMRDIFVTLVNETYDDVMKRVQCPVFMVWGEHDTAAPPQRNKRAQALFPQARLRIVEGSGHLIDAPLEAAVRDAVQQAAEVSA